MTLIGIAKAASQAPILNAKRTVTYSHLATGKWITKVATGNHGFSWSINPYRGCEMACHYCYARYTHEFMELREPEDFETRIFAKTFNKPAFRYELSKVPLSQAIAIGTATDPYQHAERRYLLTQQILEVFAAESGRKVWITTKSDLLARDLELLERVSRRNLLYVTFTVTTVDTKLARSLEPGAPRPDLRFATLSRLASAGIRCGVNVAPVIPGINDSEESMEAVAIAAKSAGAIWIGGGVLFLKSPTREVFLRYLAAEHPELATRYEITYGGGARPSREYHSLIEERFQTIRERHKLNRRAAPYLPPDWEVGRQLSLAL